MPPTPTEYQSGYADGLNRALSELRAMIKMNEEMGNRPVVMGVRIAVAHLEKIRAPKGTPK